MFEKAKKMLMIRCVKKFMNPALSQKRLPKIQKNTIFSMGRIVTTTDGKLFPFTSHDKQTLSKEKSLLIFVLQNSTFRCRITRNQPFSYNITIEGGRRKWKIQRSLIRTSST